LGNLYEKQGKLKETEEMFQRALNGYKKALGPDHSLTLNTVRILDNLYTDQGKLKEAQHMTTATVVRFENGMSWYVKIRLGET
jgi:hypothetical protein